MLNKQSRRCLNLWLRECVLCGVLSRNLDSVNKERKVYMANQVLNEITQKWNAFVHGGGKPVQFELADGASVSETMSEFLEKLSQPIEAVVTGVIGNNVCFAHIDLGYGGSVVR